MVYAGPICLLEDMLSRNAAWVLLEVVDFVRCTEPSGKLLMKPGPDSFKIIMLVWLGITYRLSMPLRPSNPFAEHATFTPICYTL